MALADAHPNCLSLTYTRGFGHIHRPQRRHPRRLNHPQSGGDAPFDSPRWRGHERRWNGFSDRRQPHPRVASGDLDVVGVNNDSEARQQPLGEGGEGLVFPPSMPIYRSRSAPCATPLRVSQLGKLITRSVSARSRLSATSVVTGWKRSMSARSAAGCIRGLIDDHGTAGWTNAP